MSDQVVLFLIGLMLFSISCFWAYLAFAAFRQGHNDEGWVHVGPTLFALMFAVTTWFGTSP